MSTIDIELLTDSTIDGQGVREITVDGDVVWTSELEAVIPSGAELRWRAGSGSGDVVDVIGGRNGSNNGIEWRSGFGPDGNYLHSGGSGYVSNGTSSFTAGGSYLSCMCWLRIDERNDSYQDRIFGHMDSGDSGGYFNNSWYFRSRLIEDSDGNMRQRLGYVMHSNSYDSAFAWDGSDFDVEEWHHFAGVANIGSWVKMYVDGVEVDHNDWEGGSTYENGDELKFSANSSRGRSYEGDASDFILGNNRFSPSEIEDYYESTKHRYGH